MNKISIKLITDCNFDPSKYNKDISIDFLYFKGIKTAVYEISGEKSKIDNFLIAAKEHILETAKKEG